MGLRGLVERENGALLVMKIGKVDLITVMDSMDWNLEANQKK